MQTVIGFITRHIDCRTILMLLHNLLWFHLFLIYQENDSYRKRKKNEKALIIHCIGNKAILNERQALQKTKYCLSVF